MNQEDPRPLDDVELARLVHDVADEWSMPPLRLDQPGWRERVRRATGRRVAVQLGGFGRRLAGAAAVALVLTLVVALAGVWLTLPRAPDVGKPGPSGTDSITPQPSPSATNSPNASPPPASATTLPGLYVSGDLPIPSKLVVQLQEGQFALADLATGKIGTPFAHAGRASQVRRAPDGSLYCLCVSGSDTDNSTFTRLRVDFNRYTADGSLVDTKEIGDFSGQPDPRDGAVPERPEHVRVLISSGNDAGYAFVGWSKRAHPVWQSGIEVVDVTAGNVVATIDLPDATTGMGETRRMTDAPRVAGAKDGQLIVDRGYYTWSPPAAFEPPIVFANDVFTVKLGDDFAADGASRPLGAAEGCGDFIDAAGYLPNGDLWLGCFGETGSSTIRRISADGKLLTDTQVPRALYIMGNLAAPSPDGTTLYVWNPIELVLTAVDLRTGESELIEAPQPTAATDWLTDFGRWLVPSTQAKVLLDAGIAVSPDGQHVYALGVQQADGPDEGGSAGLFAFNVGDSPSVERWNATADFVSVAVSKDGKYVYAAGMPGVDASGKQASQPASITVFDAATGNVRLIAGQLGDEFLTFPQALLQP